MSWRHFVLALAVAVSLWLILLSAFGPSFIARTIVTLFGVLVVVAMCSYNRTVRVRVPRGRSSRNPFG